MDIDKNGCYEELQDSVKMFGSEERDNWQCIMHLHLLQNPHLRDECFNLTSSFISSDCTGSGFSIGDEARCSTNESDALNSVKAKAESGVLLSTGMSVVHVIVYTFGIMFYYCYYGIYS